MNPRALHLLDLRLGNFVVYCSQKEPQPFRPFRDNLPPPLSQCSFGRKNYRILGILFIQINRGKNEVWITVDLGLRFVRIARDFRPRNNLTSPLIL